MMLGHQKLTTKNQQIGFTLMEILVYMVVLIIIVVAISSFLFWAIKTQAKSKVMRETLDNTRRAMEIMTYEIREAKDVYEPTSVFDSNPGQLSLEVAKYLPTGENASYLDFYLSSGRLSLKKESQNPIYLTSEQVEVSNLIFRKIISNQIPSIQIEIKADYKNPTGKPEYQASVDLRSVISLRQ